MRRILAAATLLAMAGPTAAQDAPWTVDASLYGWLPAVSTSTDTRFGTLDADLSASDVINDLDFAFMGAVVAQRGKWGVIADLVYSDVTSRKDTPFGRLFDEAKVDTRLGMLSGYVTYRVYDAPKLSVDVAGGFRAFDADIDLSMTPGETRDDPFDRSTSETWVDPLIGLRLVAPFSEKWFGTAFADLGGTSSSDRTWQAFASVGYRIDPRWSAQFGYRYMRVEHDIGDAATSIDLYGPLLGVTAHF